MLLTKEQISEQLRKYAEKKNGLHDLMEIMLESMMAIERGVFLADNPGNKGNGYRQESAYGQGGNFNYVFLMTDTATSTPSQGAILRNQEEECDRLAGEFFEGIN